MHVVTIRIDLPCEWVLSIPQIYLQIALAGKAVAPTSELYPDVIGNIGGDYPFKISTVLRSLHRDSY